MRGRLVFGSVALFATGSCIAASPPVAPGAITPPVAIPSPPPAPVAYGQGEGIDLVGEARQGGLLQGTVPAEAVQLLFNGTPVPFASDGRFLIAFDRDAENAASLRAILKDGRTIDRYLAVRPGNWHIENVDASPTGGVTTAEFQARRAGELARINAARSVGMSSNGWRQSFVWPARGRVSGVFGSQRIYRGSPGSYHSGLDIALPTGTPFVAPADGVVVLAAAEPFTLEGHLLIVDHGMGLSSAFLHCSRLDVKEGDLVRQGQVLGAVGATGRASGPHLHWGMKWNSARIDPRLLVP